MKKIHLCDGHLLLTEQPDGDGRVRVEVLDRGLLKWRGLMGRRDVVYLRAWLDMDPEEPKEPSPGVPMILTCPSCGKRHVDKDEWVTKPHHTHACQYCGMVWRPAVVETIGVQFLPGFKNDLLEPVDHSSIST